MKKLILWLLLLWCLQGAAQPETHTPRYWFNQYEAAQERNESLELQLQYLQNAMEESRTRSEYHRNHCFHYARIQHELRRTQIAYDILRQNVLRQDPNDHEANDLLGLICQRLGRLEEALIAFNAAVEEKPRNPMYRLHRANLFNQLALERKDVRQHDAATLDFNEARRRETDRDFRPILYQVYYGRGISFLGKDSLKKAAADFRTALLLNPNAAFKAKTFSGIAKILYLLKQYPAAIDTFTQAITLDNQLHDAFDGRGLCYLELEKLSDALADFSNAIEITPLPAYHYHRSLVYTRQKNYRAALSDLNVAIPATQGRATDSIASYFFQRGLVQYHLKNYAAAQTDLTVATRFDNNLATAYGYRGWAKIQIAKTSQLTEDFLKAIPDFNRAIQLQANYAWAYSGRGLAQYYSSTSLDKAKEDFDKAIRLDANLVEAYLGRGKLRTEATPEDAIADFDQVIALDKTELQWEGYACRAPLHWKAKHYVEAESDFNLLIEKRPDSLIYRLQRGLSRFHLNKFAPALEDLQPYLLVYPTHITALLYAGKIQLELKRYALSVQIAQQLKSLAPTHSEIILFHQAATEQYFAHRQRTEKPTIQWYAPIRFNDNDVNFTYYMDTTHPKTKYMMLSGKIISISDIRIQLKINEKDIQFKQRRQKDSIYELEVKIKMDSAAFLNMSLLLENAAGKIEFQKTIQVLTRGNTCAKPKKGLALVIGNANYKEHGFHSSLTNSIHDAQDVADSLRKIGFQVDTLYDGNLPQMRDAFDKFVDSLNAYEFGFFYYSGHGEQDAGINYLIPSGRTNRYSTADMFAKLNETPERACQLIMLLDACRTASSPGLKSLSRLPDNTIIGFSADIGESASDNCKNGRNGRYAYHLLQQLTQRNQAFEQLLMEVRKDVMAESEIHAEPSQSPVYSSGLKSPIYLCR